MDRRANLEKIEDKLVQAEAFSPTLAQQHLTTVRPLLQAAETIETQAPQKRAPMRVWAEHRPRRSRARTAAD
jgi:hypothetical protein